MIPSSVPVNLTTTFFEQFIVGFEKTYGKNVPVEIYVNNVEAPKSILNPGVIGMSLALEIQFLVVNPVDH